MGGVPDLLRGAVLCLLPAAVTGGIHLDGYCDTVDALASHGTPARRQEILKDPHIGAFGVIRLCGYFLLSFALWTTLAAPVGKELCLSFCLSPVPVRLGGGEVPAGKAFGPGLYLCHRRRPEAGGLDFAAGRRGPGGNRMLEKFGRRSHGAGGTAGILGLLAKVQEILWRVVRGFGRLVFAAGGALDAGGRMDCGMGGASSVIFVTGPLFAGKREYICKALGWSEEDLARRGIWEVQNLAGQEEDLEKLAKNLAQYEVVIATEVGGGVVPVDPVQRQNREAAGRLACLLAQRGGPGDPCFLWFASGAEGGTSMRVELIRHGETLWQGTGRYQGQTDVPLSEQGRQALSPASFSPEKVYITALQRTRQTAERLFPQARLVVVEDLGEMNFGRFEGRSAAEMEEDPSYRAWVEGMCRGQCPGGESLPAFSRRVCRAFARLLDWAVASEEEQLVLVVHGGTQMAVMEAFAIPSRPYFSWGLPCGQGYVLEAEGWLEHRQLRLLGKRDYTKGG